MKYSELNDKDRWAAIRAGVKAGYTNIDDIEKAYNEYAEGGHLKQDDYYNNVLLQKDSNQKQYIKEQLEKRKTYADGGNTHKFGYGSNISGYSENDDALTFYKDVDDIYVTPNGNYYQGKEFNKRKQQDIIADINNNPSLLFRPEYNKWYNHNRTEAKKKGWDFDETMSTMFNRLPFESQEWIVQNNPSAFRLLPQNIQSDYITRTKGMRPGALQRLVDDAGENFLGKSVNNAVTAASLISLPTALKSGRLIKSGIDKVADIGYKALNSTNVGRNATNLMTKAVLPAVETKWGIEGAMNLPNDLRNINQAINEGDYIGAGFEGVNTAFDASMIPLGVKNIPGLASGVKNEVGRVVENVGKRVNPLGEPVVPEGFTNIQPQIRTKLGDVEINNPSSISFEEAKRFKKDNPMSIQDIENEWQKAVDAGDMAEVQRLRDLHFKMKSPNNVVVDENGMPLQLYHNTQQKFNSFDISKTSHGKTEGNGVYSGINPQSLYGENQMNLYANVSNPYIENKEWSSTTALGGWTPSQFWNTGKYSKNDDLYPIRNYKEYRKFLSDSNPLEKIKSTFRVGEYSKDSYKKHLDYATEKRKQQIEYNNDIDKVANADGVIVNWQGHPVNPKEIVTLPNKYKLSDAVTYDDLGKIIPLSKRDNFDINDIRYSLLPAGVGLSGYSLINNAD